MVPGRLAAHAAGMDPFDLLDRIALVLDPEGRIERVNAAWCRAGRARGLHAPDRWVGSDYLALTRAAADRGDPRAAEVLRGLRALLARTERRLELGYPCDDPDADLAWKTLVALALPDGRILLVHLDAPDPRLLAMSERRLAELAYRRLLHIDTRCAWCRRMADPDGAWSERPSAAGADVTDGLCPDCDARLTAGLDDPALPAPPPAPAGGRSSERGTPVAA